MKHNRVIHTQNIK